MKFKFKHRSQNKIFVWTLILGPFLIAPLTQFLGLPSFIKYILDLSCLLLLITMIFKKKRVIDNSARFLLCWILVFFIFTLINYFAHYQSPLYYLWGLRNNFRGYILFAAVIFYFDEKDSKEVLSLFNKIFYINALVMLFQYFAFGFKRDNLGGIFGVESGCNGDLNLFLCIMIIINFVLYYNNKQSIKITALNAVLMLVLAAIAELKFFYVEFVVLIVIGVLITRFSWKKVCIVAVGALALFIGYHVFISVFPESDFSIHGMIEYASTSKGYTSSGDLNRLSFIPTINNSILQTFDKQLFGLGLGNCDYATGIDVLTTSFYNNFEWMHYEWLSTTFVYLESGIIGLIMFFGFYVAAFVNSLRMRKKIRSNNVFCQLAALCAIAAILNGVYNCSLRQEAGYMIYFMLAIPWCASRIVKRRKI